MTKTNYDHAILAKDVGYFIGHYAAVPASWIQIASMYSVMEHQYWVRVTVLGLSHTIKVNVVARSSEIFEQAYPDMKDFVMALWGEPKPSWVMVH